MEKWVLIGEFLSDRARYNKLTKLFVDYNPDSKTIIFPKEKTGWETEQTAKTESDIGWHIVEGDKNTFYAISAKTSTFQLSLFGEKGFHYAKDLITDYVNMLYACNEIQAKGIGITKSFFEKLPEHIKELKGRYWIPERHYDEDEEVYYEIYTVWDGNLRGDMLVSTSGNEYSAIHSMRPCVQLPTNTLVNIGDTYYNGSTPERALKIKI